MERKSYYAVLEKTKKGTLDVTEWLKWFLHCLMTALLTSESMLEKVIRKHRFWSKQANVTFNARLTKLLHRLLNGFTGKLTTAKWAKIAKCSSDTALRDVQDLMHKNILRKAEGGGRSTNYFLTNF